MLDEQGMPVPSFKLPMKRDEAEPHKIRDADREVVAYINCAGDQDILEHAANWIIPCREIVRRLAEWVVDDPASDNLASIATDAAKLWGDMQRDAKGGDNA